MQLTGQRHEFLSRYRAAYTQDGKVEALEVDMYANGGCSLDLTPAVIEVAMFAVDNCYLFKNLRLRGVPCRTNRVSCTAFRGFGKPQAMATTEAVLDHVARHAGLSPMAVRDANLLRPGDCILDGSPVEEALHRCWAPLKEKFAEKQAAALKFNAENRYRKRGVALLPSRNNIGFEANMLNQGSALVHVYTDGSVMVTHGGSEMGQGLNTKMGQIAADVLRCPPERVHVSANATDRVPNSSPTAASTGSDINGHAVADACGQIRKRLDALSPSPQATGNASWEALVKRAYAERVQLSASGFHSFEKYTFDWQTRRGRCSLYHIWGAAMADVELDVLTGRWHARTVDVVQDVGSGSLNPAVDVGQIEGGLMQGLGLYTLEELTWAADGHLRSRNASTYKIPAHDNTPDVINVTLLHGSASTGGVGGQKSTSEVGVQLSACVLYALKEAVYSAREEAGVRAHLRLDTPATVEKVRLACPTPFNS
eukprot:TRINITY_DN215_c0_g2_i2.p2 TRINITY_DN215_c0_g2~~TRINITY_DN215_c0_g2_i2.p2  ORF type:complete len:525 (+),score=170.59 TRINITY_DN215_c0_g2_i2:131-1576(+)